MCPVDMPTEAYIHIILNIYTEKALEYDHVVDTSELASVWCIVPISSNVPSRGGIALRGNRYRVLNR